MNVSRLCSVSIVLGVAAGATIIACGSSSKGTPDAKVFKDAGTNIDAAGSGSGGGGIGKICTGGGSGDSALCVPTDPICTSLTGTAWFCTESCGTGPCAAGGTAGSANCLQNGSAQPMRPAGGNAICAAQKSMTTATPACALYSAGSGSGNLAVNWACALECGTFGSANLGTCPTGLTCTSNFCQ